LTVIEALTFFDSVCSVMATSSIKVWGKFDASSHEPKRAYLRHTKLLGQACQTFGDSFFITNFEDR
jgi:hypothetical protein